MKMELGISSFGDVHPDGGIGKSVNAHRRMQELLAEIKLADEVGLDVFALGEHHRPDFMISAPEVILAAAAAITKNIRLSSAVTVLSSADPVRTYQNFATVDLISGGRAEIMAGRGSFIESFPLFGYSLNDYDELFNEKLEMLLNINEHELVSWKGKFRAPLVNRGIYPRPLQDKLPVWLAAGGTPASAKRAGRMNLPIMLAMLGGSPEHFIPFVQKYKQAAVDAGHDASKLQLGISSQFHIAESSDEAGFDFYPGYEKLMNRVGQERGWSLLSKDQYEYLRAKGPLMVGSVQEAVDKILYQYELYGNTRFLAQLVGDDMPHEKVLKSIELYGTKVAPAVRKALADK